MDETLLYAEGVKLPDPPEDKDAEEHLNSVWEEDAEFLDRVIADKLWSETFYAARNRMMENHVKWFFGQHYENDDPNRNYDSAIPSTATNDGNEHLVTLNIPYTSVVRAHTMMTNEDPAFEVLSNLKNKGKVEQLLYGVHYINSLRWGSDVMSDAIFDQILKGWGCVRTTWTSYEEAEEFEGDLPDYEFPIMLVAIDPMEIYPIPGGTRERWSAILHRTQKRVYEVEDEWNVKLHRTEADVAERREANERAAKRRSKGYVEVDPNEPLDRNDMVEFVDYWAWSGSKIMHAVVANEQFVKRPTWMKNYDSLPFTIFFCTQTTVRDRGEYFGLPANFALVDSVSELEWLINRHARIVDMYADPTLVIKKINNNSVEEMVAAGILELSEGEDVHYLQFQGTLPDIPRLEEFFSRQIEEDGFGFPRGGGESGLDTIAQQQAGLVKIFKPVENAEDAYERINSKVIGLLQRYSWDSPVHVEGRREGETATETWSFSIKGKDTKGMRSTRARIRAKFPLEELRNAATANILVNGELFPREMAMKRFLHIQDTETALDLIDRDRIRRDPQLSQQLIGLRLQELMQSSTVMDMVSQELETQADGVPIEERTSQATSGAPENPAPVDGGPLSQAPSQLEQSLQEGMTGMGMPPDNMAQDLGGMPTG